MFDTKKCEHFKFLDEVRFFFCFKNFSNNAKLTKKAITLNKTIY